MNVSIKVLLRGAIWTLGGFGAGQIIRLATNIILARILAPQLFGLMLIVSTVRFGIELMSDIGIGQNIIYSPHANEPEFYNTAWSLQLFRSVGLFLLIVAVSSPLAHFYNSPILVYLLPVTGIMTLLGGLTSVSPQILQKRLQFGRLNLFQLIITIISSVLYIMVVYFHPTIWGMVLGNILGSAATAIGSYFILPEIKQRFLIAKRFFNEIIHFREMDYSFLRRLLLVNEYRPVVLCQGCPSRAPRDLRHRTLHIRALEPDGRTSGKWGGLSFRGFAFEHATPTVARRGRANSWKVLVAGGLRLLSFRRRG